MAPIDLVSSLGRRYLHKPRSANNTCIIPRIYRVGIAIHITRYVVWRQERKTILSDLPILAGIMSVPTNNAEFFPSIGSVASRTDLLPEEQEDAITDADEQGNDDRPMQEVSSLCMSCGEQVWRTLVFFFEEHFPLLRRVSLECSSLQFLSSMRSL